MFAAYCESHGSRVLLGSRAIIGIDNTDAGIVVNFRCHCGHEGSFLTGANVPTPSPAQVAVAA